MFTPQQEDSFKNSRINVKLLLPTKPFLILPETLPPQPLPPQLPISFTEMLKQPVLMLLTPEFKPNSLF